MLDTDLKPFSCEIVLLVPPGARPVYSIESLGVEYIASCCRASGLRAGILNCGLHGLDERQALQVLLRSDFKVLGVSTLHATYISGLWLAKNLKLARPGVKVLFGGLEAGIKAQETLRRHSYIDAVCTGEGEHLAAEYCRAVLAGGGLSRIPGLLYRRGAGVKSGGQRALVSDLDSLPAPARDDMERVKELDGPVAVSSSRGCFGACKFCSVRTFYALSRGAAWRCRSAESVVGEIEALNGRYGTDLFAFIDETAAGPGESGLERLAGIADLILDRGLKIEFFASVRADQVSRALFRRLARAGLVKVEIGIESMSPAQLERYGKSTSVRVNREALRILDSLGIACEEFMIPFDAGTTRADLELNLDFFEARFRSAAENRRYTLSPLLMDQYLYPYFGTRTHREYLEQFGGEGKFYFEYRAKDPSIEAVHGIFSEYLRAAEYGFPLSYSGFGNLWRKRRRVPEACFDEASRCAADFGLNNVACLRYLLSRLAGGAGRRGSPSTGEIREKMLGFYDASAAITARFSRAVGKFRGQVLRSGAAGSPAGVPAAGVEMRRPQGGRELYAGRLGETLAAYTR